jgi:hypothetical protein
MQLHKFYLGGGICDQCKNSELSRGETSHKNNDNNTHLSHLSPTKDGVHLVLFFTQLIHAFPYAVCLDARFDRSEFAAASDSSSILRSILGYKLYLDRRASVSFDKSRKQPKLIGIGDMKIGNQEVVVLDRRSGMKNNSVPEHRLQVTKHRSRDESDQSQYWIRVTGRNVREWLKPLGINMRILGLVAHLNSDIMRVPRSTARDLVEAQFATSAPCY